MKRLQNERQLNATREKLQMLQQNYEMIRQRTGGNQHTRELTLRSFGRLIKQLKEEIIWYECHAGVREPVDSAVATILNTGGPSAPCTN